MNLQETNYVIAIEALWGNRGQARNITSGIVYVIVVVIIQN